MHRWMGAEATGSIGLHSSRFQLTDYERQLRDLAYPLVEPPHSRPAWKSVFGDYEPAAPPWRQSPTFDRSAYGRQLIDEPHRSNASRYAQLIDDVRDDITRFDPFFNTARQVFDLDSKRNASLKFVSDLSPRERADAVARMEENTLIVQWVQQCLEQRIASYRWALEHLVVHAPDGIAADADRLIGHLAALAANPPVTAQPGYRPRLAYARVGHLILARRKCRPESLGSTPTASLRASPRAARSAAGILQRRARLAPAPSFPAPAPAPSKGSALSSTGNR